MKSIEDFFKNRIYYYDCIDAMGDHAFNNDFEVKWDYKSKI